MWRVIQKAAYTNSLEQEMQMQVGALISVQEEKGSAYGKNSQTVAYLKSEGGSEYLAMERVRGKTLYRILLDRMYRADAGISLFAGHAAGEIFRH